MKEKKQAGKKLAGPEFTEGSGNYKLLFMGKGIYEYEAPKQKSETPKRRQPAPLGYYGKILHSY